MTITTEATLSPSNLKLPLADVEALQALFPGLDYAGGEESGFFLYFPDGITEDASISEAQAHGAHWLVQWASAKEDASLYEALQQLLRRHSIPWIQVVMVTAGTRLAPNTIGGTEVFITPTSIEFLNTGDLLHRHLYQKQ